MFFLKELPTRQMLDRYSERFTEMDIEKTNNALVLLRTASVLMRQLDRYFEQFDLSQSKVLIMIMLDREPGKPTLTMKELSDRLDISQPVLTRTLSALVKKNYVQTTASDKDGRQKLNRLTGRGRKKLYAIIPGYHEILKGVNYECRPGKNTT